MAGCSETGGTSCLASEDGKSPRKGTTMLCPGSRCLPAMVLHHESQVAQGENKHVHGDEGTCEEAFCHPVLYSRCTILPLFVSTLQSCLYVPIYSQVHKRHQDDSPSYTYFHSPRSHNIPRFRNDTSIFRFRLSNSPVTFLPRNAISQDDTTLIMVVKSESQLMTTSRKTNMLKFAGFFSIPPTSFSKAVSRNFKATHEHSSTGSCTHQNGRLRCSDRLQGCIDHSWPNTFGSICARRSSLQ